MKKSEKVILFVLCAILILLFAFLQYKKIEEKSGNRRVGYVYFLKNIDEHTYLVGIKRPIPLFAPIENKIGSLINSLLVGPNEEEKKEDISTSIPEGVKLLSVRKIEDTIYLDFSEEIEQGGGISLMETRLAQIVFTATQFPEVKKVKILIGGKEVKYFSGEGIMIDKPLEKDDFNEFEIIDNFKNQ